MGLLFGVWKRWNEFYSTLLFWITGDMLYGSLLYNYKMWEFRPLWIDLFILPTHQVIATAIAILIYPCVIVVYLGRFPKSKVKKFSWVIIWALIFQCVETIAYFNKRITHHHGWSLAWSFIFNLMTFSILAIHKWKPWVAWILSAIFIFSLWIIFEPPLPE